MAYRRATFEVTCGVDGQGTDDVILQMPYAPVRNALLTAVLVDTSDAVINPTPSVCIDSLTTATVATGDTTAETYEFANQLFYVDMGLDTTNYPSRDSIYEYLVDSALGRTNIRTRFARCTVTNGGSGDVFTVYMHFETPGDYRF